MTFRATLLILVAASALTAAEFQSGQAARAVLGQSSFTSRDAGVKVQSMTIAGSDLFAADSLQQIQTFDLSKLPDVLSDFSNRETTGCGVCSLLPAAVTHESVLPGIAAASHWGTSVAVVDAVKHRVLIWRDSSSPRANLGPDVILGQADDTYPTGPSTLVKPVSVALDGRRVFVGDAALHRVLVWNTLPTSANQPADAVLGQQDFTSSLLADSPTPDSIVQPAALVSDGTNLFVGDPASQRILVFSPADSALNPHSVLNSASQHFGPIGAGALITINASGLSDTTVNAESGNSSALPKHLGNTEVVFDGEALPLLSVSPLQLQAQIPFDLENRAAASLYVRTEHAGAAPTVTAPLNIRLSPAAPGLFAFSGSEPRGGIVLHTGPPADPSSGGAPVTDESPATAGEVITVWATGLGAILDGNGGASAIAGVPFIGPAAPTVTPVTARVNGQDAQVLSAELPKNSVGVYQVKILVPGSHQVKGNLLIAQNGIASNLITFSLKPAP